MTVKIVDAAKIRNSIDTDFCGWGSHADYPYIPLGELWIDKHLRGEKELFTSLVRLERSMRGKPFRTIRAAAKKTFVHPKKAKLAIVKKEKKGALTILSVDGSTVRSGMDPYFVVGGHDLACPYIPKHELWIDTRSDRKELKYLLIRLMDERERMSKGMSVENAHDFAIATERMARRKDGVADFTRG